MTFDEILDQAIEMLQRSGRLTYRTLKVQFDLNDDLLEVLKEELLYSQPQVVDDEGKGLIWTGATETQPEPSNCNYGIKHYRTITYTNCKLCWRGIIGLGVRFGSYFWGSYLMTEGGPPDETILIS